MKITEKQKVTLKRYIPNLEELISKDDLQTLQSLLNDAIVDSLEAIDNGAQYEATPESRELEKVYDEIYDMNCEK